MTGLQAVADVRRRVDPAWLSVPAGVLAGAGILAYAPLSGDAAAMLAITVFCIGLWIGTPVEPWFTGVVCLGLVGVVFSTDLALVGFRSPATWLIVFGVVLGEAVRQSGLATALESWIFRRMPAAAATDATAAFRYLLVAFSALGLGLVAVIPSSLVRVLLLGPILIAVSDVFDERRPRLGLVLGPLFVTYYAGAGVLTGSVANIIVVGIVESSTDVSIGWVEWLVWLGPVMAVGRALVVAAIASLLFRPRESASVDRSARDDSPDRDGATDCDGTTDRDDADHDGPTDCDDADHDGTTDRDGFTDSGDTADSDVSSDVRRMVAFLLVGVAIWATDAIHGLHPLYGVLVVVLLAFAPRIGVVGPDALADADFSIVFFLGAIFAIAEGLQRTGVTEEAAAVLLSVLDPDAPLVVILVVVVLAVLALTVVVEGLAAASVLTPVLVSFAASAGLPLEPIVMIEAVALGTYFFPYQSAVLVAMLGLEGVESVDLIRMAAVCSLATLLVLLPIQLALFALFF